VEVLFPSESSGSCKTTSATLVPTFSKALKYFARIQYHGKQYAGWQRQPNANSVQAEIEKALSTIFREEISIMGCGRTDAGVHAKKFYFHFNAAHKNPHDHIQRINGFLPKDISIHEIHLVPDEAHARFDANRRAYQYHVSFCKDVGGTDIDFQKLNQVATLIKSYNTFFPFCKSNHDAHTLVCSIYESRWEQVDDQHLIYHIAANRFLRGMVRLIVGCSIRVATGKLSIDKIKQALDNQTRIDNAYSAPAQGLFLTEVHYPLSVGLPLT